MSFEVRRERPGDAAQVAAVIEAAFGGPAVADFAAALRRSDEFVPELAFVAEDGEDIVGHTMLSRVELQGHGAVRILTPLSPSPPDDA